MKKAKRRWAWAGEDGQALVEFALLLPVLFLILAGIIEFGRAWNIKLAVTDAAREGSRFAALWQDSPKSEDDVRQRVRDRLALAGIEPADVDVDVTGLNDPDPNHPVEVRVTTEYEMPWVGTLLKWGGGSKTIDIVSASAMRNEAAP